MEGGDSVKRAGLTSEVRHNETLPPTSEIGIPDSRGYVHPQLNLSGG
jgi:hypothetical protein